MSALRIQNGTPRDTSHLSRCRSHGVASDQARRTDLRYEALEPRFLLAARPWEFLDATSQIQQIDDSPGDPVFRAVQPGDFNKDGKVDVVVAQARSVAGITGTPERGILLLNENGKFVDRTAQYFPGLMTPETRWWIVPHDFFHTGWTDLFVSGANGEPSKFYKNLGNDGNGQWLGFADESNRIQGASASETDSYHTHKADVNGDTWWDLVEYQNHPETGLGQIRVLINNGSQFVDETSTRLPQRQEPSVFGHVEDLSGDGFPDISVANLFPTGGIPELRVLINDGTGHFPTSLEQTLPQPTSSGGVYGLDHVDVNGDGKLDIYVINFGGQGNSFRDAVLLNLGTGNNLFNTVYFPEHPNGLMDSDGDHPVAADFDGDGKMDIAVAQFATKTYMLHNQTENGVTKLVERTPPQIPSTSGFRARAFDWNGDGAQDLIIGLRPVDAGFTLMIGNVGEQEGNNHARHANVVTTFPALITGAINVSRDIDVFKLPERAYQEGCRIRLIPESAADMRLEILNYNGAILSVIDGAGPGGIEQSIQTAGSAARYVRVTGKTLAVTGTYRLEIDVQPSATRQGPTRGRGYWFDEGSSRRGPQPFIRGDRRGDNVRFPQQVTKVDLVEPMQTALLVPKTAAANNALPQVEFETNRATFAARIEVPTATSSVGGADFDESLLTTVFALDLL